MSRASLTGALLFLPIPVVLVLYLRRPLGLGPSIVLGVAIMFGHRFVARPFMDRWISRRCFWCGCLFEGAGVEAPFRSRNETIPARTCCTGHADDLNGFARAVSRGRHGLKALIVLPVFIYLGIALLTLAHASPIAIDGAVWLFKVPVAAAVVGLSFLWPLGRRVALPPAIDFPPHNLALLGVRNMLWIFRVVGLFWLAQAVWGAASGGLA